MSQSSDNRWLFDLNQLKNSPSSRDGIGYNEQMMLRHRGTNLIREMAQELKLRPIVMQTAMVYYHRFFTLRSFAKFDAYRMAVCSLFLASKWDDQPIFMEHIIKLLYILKPAKFPKESYHKECEYLVNNEAEMLFTFGFEMSVTHAHTIIAQDFDSPVISKIIQKNAYIIASDLLRLSTICLQFTPPFIACVCVYLASVLMELPINHNNWCSIIDPTISLSDVQREAEPFKAIVNPSHLSLDEKKSKTQSFASSPESAYSSGAPESPDIANHEQQSQNLNKTQFNTKNYQWLEKSREYQKKRTIDKNDKLQPKTSLEKTTTLMKNTSLNGALTCIKQSNGHTVVDSVPISSLKRHLEDQNGTKFQKVVNTNGTVVRRPVVAPSKTSDVVKQTKVRTVATSRRPVIDPKKDPRNFAVAVCPTSKTNAIRQAVCAPIDMTSAAKQVKSSSTVKQLQQSTKDFKNLNLKITISSNNNTKTDPLKRVVCSSTSLVNATHVSKVS